MSVYDNYCKIYLLKDHSDTPIKNEIAALLAGEVSGYTVQTDLFQIDVFGNKEYGDSSFFGVFDMNIEIDWDNSDVCDETVILELRKIVSYVKSISSRICVVSKFSEFEKL